ncbi:MAG: IS30 family transposase [Cellvibrionaceae bacterium]|jgi:IS30 family transposase
MAGTVDFNPKIAADVSHCVPRNTDLKTVTQMEVRRAVKRLNSRPRKNLEYKMPDQLMSTHRAGLAA